MTDIAPFKDLPIKNALVDYNAAIVHFANAWDEKAEKYSRVGTVLKHTEFKFTQLMDIHNTVSDLLTEMLEEYKGIK